MVKSCVMLKMIEGNGQRSGPKLGQDGVRFGRSRIWDSLSKHTEAWVRALKYRDLREMPMSSVSPQAESGPQKHYPPRHQPPRPHHGGRRDNAVNRPGKGGSRHGFRPPALKTKGPTRRRRRRPKRPRESTRQSMAADFRESRGIVLVIVGQF